MLDPAPAVGEVELTFHVQESVVLITGGTVLLTMPDQIQNQKNNPIPRLQNPPFETCCISFPS